MAKKESIKRLAEYGKKDRHLATDKIQDWLDQDLIITAMAVKSGEHGEFAVFHATDENGHEHVFSSGAQFVFDALTDAAFQDAFPLAVNFYMVGNTILFT